MQIVKVNFWLLLAGLNGLVSVLMGAMGAHAFGIVRGSDAYFMYNQGTQFHFTHTLAMMGASILASMAVSEQGQRLVQWAGVAFQLGIILFSGSLYWLGIHGPNSLGSFHWLPPLGGSALIVGWLALSMASYKIVLKKEEGSH